MFDAEDWLARLLEAGGTVRIDVVKIWPPEWERGEVLSPECAAIWAEIGIINLASIAGPHGPENRDKQRQVYELVRSKVGPIEAGWEDYPR
jgi:hypothetical protein